jgi:hypothetical protein
MPAGMHQSLNMIHYKVMSLGNGNFGLPQLVFQLGDYDSNAVKMTYNFSLVLQQKCRVNLIYDNVFIKVRTARGNLLACKNEFCLDEWPLMPFS